MRVFPNFNVSKSIEQKRLIYKISFLEKVDVFIHILIFFGFIYGLFALYSSQKEFNENERFFIYIIGGFTLFSGLLMFKKLTEKRLKSVKTNNTKEKNVEIINKIAKENGWFRYKNSNDILIFCEESEFFSNYIKIFLLRNDMIFYTVLTERFRLNYPTLTDSRSVRKLLEKGVKE